MVQRAIKQNSTLAKILWIINTINTQQDHLGCLDLDRQQINTTYFILSRKLTG